MGWLGDLLKRAGGESPPQGDPEGVPAVSKRPAAMTSQAYLGGAENPDTAPSPAAFTPNPVHSLAKKLSKPVSK